MILTETTRAWYDLIRGVKFTLPFLFMRFFQYEIIKDDDDDV